MDMKSVEQFLDIISNPDKFKASVAILKDEQARLDVMIAAVGKIGDIQKLHTKAEKALAAAEAKAEEILTEAQRVAEGKLAELNGRLAEVAARESEVTTLKSEVTTITKEIRAKLKDVEKREDALVIREADIAARTGHLDQAIADFNARAEKLKQAIGQ